MLEVFIAQQYGVFKSFAKLFSPLDKKNNNK